MNYIAHFQQFIKLYKTPLNPKNGLPSTTFFGLPDTWKADCFLNVARLWLVLGKMCHTWNQEARASTSRVHPSQSIYKTRL